MLHSHRHRLGFGPGSDRFASLQERLAGQPPITVPAVTPDGPADGSFPATDGTASAHHVTGPRLHRQVGDTGHNLPQEAPRAFADAVLALEHL